MLKNKSKKIVILTGGLGFLGKEFTIELARNNFTPIIIDKKSLPEIKKFIKQIKSNFYVNIDGYSLDITKENKVKEVSKKILKKYKKIDILINNAANNPIVTKSKNFPSNNNLEKLKLKNWEKDINVGLTGSFLASKYFGSIISKNPNGGSIINISSDLGLIAPDHRLYLKNQKKPITYSVVKTGILGLSKYLSTYWPKKVRSNAVCFGGVKNDQNSKFLKKVNKLIPLGRLAKPGEYNGVITFLCSDNSSYLNGAVIPVDGGRTSW